MLTKYMVIFGILFTILHKLHSVNRRNFEDFFGEDMGRLASYFRWDTEKAHNVMRDNFGSSLQPTASVTSGFSDNKINSEKKPEVFERLSVNNKKMNQKYDKYAKHRFGSIRTSVRNKMQPVEHMKLNRQIKKCKRKAEMIGGHKGRELFKACKREYNRRLNKTNTENYVNSYIGNSKVTPSVAGRYLKSNIRSSNRSFKKNRIKYLDGKSSRRLFRENFLHNNKNYKKMKSKLLKRLGLVFRVTFLICFVCLMIFIIQDTFKDVKFTSLKKAQTM